MPAEEVQLVRRAERVARRLTAGVSRQRVDPVDLCVTRAAHPEALAVGLIQLRGRRRRERLRLRLRVPRHKRHGYPRQQRPSRHEVNVRRLVPNEREGKPVGGAGAEREGRVGVEQRRVHDGPAREDRRIHPAPDVHLDRFGPLGEGARRGALVALLWERVGKLGPATLGPAQHEMQRPAVLLQGRAREPAQLRVGVAWEARGDRPAEHLLADRSGLAVPGVAQ